MSVSLAPPPFLQFMNPNNSGSPAAGFKLFTYQAGTTTKQATWTDSTQGTVNANPIILDANGVANVWGDQSLFYKFVLASPNDTDPPTSPLRTVDNVQFPQTNVLLTSQLVGQLLNPQTIAEQAAGVTPSNYVYLPGDIRRYGADPTNTNDSTNAIQAAINVASQNLGGFVYVPAGEFKVTATLVIGAGKQVNIQGAGKFLSILFATGFGSDVPILNYQGTTGSRIDAVHCRGLALWSNNNLARGITATWVINSAFDDLYFYQLTNGWVGTNSFGNGFRNNNSFSVTTNVYVLNASCNNSFFEKTRMASCLGGIAVNNVLDTLTVIGCDFEGITSGGAAITLQPATTTVCNNVVVMGSHFENINGTAILCSGADANSVTNLMIRDNTITGGFFAAGNTSATKAIVLSNVNGFDISNNNVTDWGTNDGTGGGTQGYMCGSISGATNGTIQNNTSILSSGSPLAVQNIGDATPPSSVLVANNWTPVHGTGFLGYAVNYSNPNEVTVTYSASMNIDSNTGAIFDITANNNTAFSINTATNGYKGKQITVKIRNTSGGALGAISWGGGYKLSTATPANGFSRSFIFVYDGTNWIQTAGAPNDVPN